MGLAALVLGLLAILGGVTGVPGIICGILAIVFGCVGRKSAHPKMAGWGIVLGVIALFGGIIILIVGAGVIAGLAFL